ncbi:MAG: peptidoglycan-binding protein [Veillonella sp.]|nr:peptidoglycan-binding protein [Veillonella sp.]
MKKQIMLLALVCTTFLATSTAMAANLQTGSRGSEVRHLQDMLVTQGYLIDNVDGIFGNNTEYAVRVFQAERKMPVTGIVDYKLLKAIEKNNERFAAKALANGVPAHYKKALDMESTAYSAADSSGITARGNALRRGFVSVDPKVIPLGTEVFVEGYGYAIADDTGGAIRGHRIDVAMDSHYEAIQWGRRSVRVYILK